jgi:hypothetical protein
MLNERLEAAKELQRRHRVAATATPEHIRVSLYGRRLDPMEAADEAAIHHRGAPSVSKRPRSKR